MNIFLKKQLGFTMIELLVVIAIISFIASAAIYSVQVARIKARDTKRIADLSQIRKALDMYFSDNNKYPDMSGSGGVGTGTSSYTSGLQYTNWVLLQNALKPYMGVVPNDPINSGNPFWDGGYAYRYIRNLNDKTYDLITQLEDTSNPNICGKKCYLYHSANNQPWCNAFCWGVNEFSDYIFADH